MLEACIGVCGFEDALTVVDAADVGRFIKAADHLIEVLTLDMRLAALKEKQGPARRMQTPSLRKCLKCLLKSQSA